MKTQSLKFNNFSFVIFFNVEVSGVKIVVLNIESCETKFKNINSLLQ